MKLLRNSSKNIKFYNNTRHSHGLITFPLHKYSSVMQLQDEQKSLEFSDLDDNNSNSLLESISQSQAFKDVASDDKRTTMRGARVGWQRQNRALDYKKERTNYSDVYNVSSVKELHQILNKYKNMNKPNKTSKKNIMDLLNSLSGDNDNEINDGDIDQNESETLSKPDGQMAKYMLPDVYARAIRVCGFLKEFDEGFKLFEEVKSDSGLLRAEHFASAMWLTVEQSLNRDSLDKCYQLMDDMVNIYDIKPNGACYREVIANAVNLNHWRRAAAFIDEILNQSDDKRKYQLLQSNALKIAILQFYAKGGKIEKALQFMKYLSDTYGKEVLSDYMYSTVLSGIASGVLSDKSLVDIAEALFQQSFDVLGTPGGSVFGALINVYAHVPDVHSCVDMIKTMHAKDEWPMPNDVCYSAAFKALKHYGSEKQLNYEEGWKIADELLDLMDKHNIQKNNFIVPQLFNLCGGWFVNKGDIDKLYKYYDEVIADGLKVSPFALEALLLAGIQIYGLEMKENPQNQKLIDQDLKKYVDWALLQYKQHNVSLLPRTKILLEKRLQEIF